MGAFTVANKVPNLVRTLLADTALSAAFIPVFSDLLREGAPPRSLAGGLHGDDRRPPAVLGRGHGPGNGLRPGK